MIITTPTAGSTPVHPVEFSNLTPDLPADQQHVAAPEVDDAPPCTPVLFLAPRPTSE